MAKGTAAKKKPRKATRRRSGNRVGPITEVTTSRDIEDRVRWMLWGQTAGRCEFSGCNRILWKSPVTQEQVNVAEAAHIYAFSAKGPRGNRGIDKQKLNQVDNLMLACHDCHKKMDQSRDGGRYTVELLQQWKQEHERRIENVTGIDPKKASHIVVYGANIGEQGSQFDYSDVAQALFPRHYPADNRPISLGVVDGSRRDSDPTFWEEESQHLQTRFRQRIYERLADGDIKHLSVFGLAPQPLLILLGTLMVDIPRAEIFQLFREPPGWRWPDQASKLNIKLIEPDSFSGQPALVLSMSATVTSDRITDVLGSGTSIWTVTVPKPNNDFTRSRHHLSTFRKALRPVLDEIKARHGQSTMLHIFPAMSVSLAIELGRIRMPKAEMPWQIYDQNNALGGFAPALQIG